MRLIDSADGSQTIYLVRLNPGDDPATYKVGHSTHLASRMLSIMTVAPRARVVSVWLGSTGDESALLRGLRRTPHEVDHVGGEVFQVSGIGADEEMTTAIEGCLDGICSGSKPSYTVAD